MPDLTLAQADAVIDATLAEAVARGLRPMAVAVVDAAGLLKAFKKADGASALRFEMAMGKAYAAVALSFGRSGAVRTFLEPRPRFAEFLDGASGGRLWAEPGGVRILDADGGVLGAVGVTGDVSDLDEECGAAGIVAAGLIAAG
ncbi:heme-binding protein [Actinomycetospora sp. TBRC 11914]|uniref:GlcG/HbpS family heme-binding protein n=1 Tax=Actinomycetospora sp. TBRC 11914 TaxID=2729387 RepID=UPI00145EFE22|nr:heme-binding protein [Actinomycetospora sp. TBRC 11914]NMO91715.1 heme-binding protein [Actinomycetospora sp. TBRC 11914]